MNLRRVVRVRSATHEEGQGWRWRDCIFVKEKRVGRFENYAARSTAIRQRSMTGQVGVVPDGASDQDIPLVANRTGEVRGIGVVIESEDPVKGVSHDLKILIIDIDTGLTFWAARENTICWGD